jgi:hypothetical protein
MGEQGRQDWESIADSAEAPPKADRPPEPPNIEGDWETRKRSEPVITGIGIGIPEGDGPPPVVDYPDEAPRPDEAPGSAEPAD